MEVLCRKCDNHAIGELQKKLQCYGGERTCLRRYHKQNKYEQARKTMSDRVRMSGF